MWANPEMRRRLTDSIRSRKASPESRRRMSEIRQLMWQDPEYRSRMLAIIAENSRKPEVRAKLSELLRERFKDPKWRAKWLASIRKDRATSETPAQKTEIPSDLPASQPYEPPVSTFRRLEEDAIAAFLRSKGATQVPAVGSLELLKLVDTAPLVYDKQTRKAARRPVVAAT